jgi:hypothetical protein
MNKKKLYKKGSLLLEALLSVVILSTSITLIIQAMTSSLRATRYSLGYLEALFIAENELFDSLTKGALLEDEFGQEDIENQYVSEVSSELFVDEISPAGEDEENIISHVRVDIGWQLGRKRNSVTMETLVFESEE